MANRLPGSRAPARPQRCAREHHTIPRPRWSRQLEAGTGEVGAQQQIDWEGDLIMGAGNRSAIGTLVQRTTRFLVLLPFCDGIATTDGVRRAITSVLGSLPQPLRRTLTWDQGKELAMHQQITASTGTGVYFCDAHSPWQRGSNENINGLLRDYFPKGTKLGVHTVEDIARIAAEVNERPRKTLEWQRPAALFNSEIAVATVEARGSDETRAAVRTASALRAFA